MRLSAVAPADVLDLWPQIRDRIAACCARSGGKYEPVDVLQQTIVGRMQLWLVREERAIQALAITEIVPYPRITVCKLVACTGEQAPRWVDLIGAIESWAKDHGCAVLEPVCRPGWERHLRPRGYRKTHVVLEKTL